ncbi:MAG TPA: TspO/MBR family protein [Saliniramus sp.]|nr:TspO/MBR family protein [Saliniramus sp.]
MNTMRNPAPPLSRWPRLAAAVLPVLLTWGAASIGTPAGMDWYQTLTKPDFTPPGWVFGPAWTLLYAFMIYVAWRLLGLPESRGRTRALVIFYGQLVLNAGWSFAFFYAQSPIGGLVVIAALTACVLAAIRVFWPIDRLSGILFIPYALWLFFAGAINLGIVILA